MAGIGEEIGQLHDGLDEDRALWTDASMPAATPLTGERLGRVRVADAAGNPIHHFAVQNRVEFRFGEASALGWYGIEIAVGDHLIDLIFQTLALVDCTWLVIDAGTTEVNGEHPTNNDEAEYFANNVAV